MSTRRILLSIVFILFDFGFGEAVKQNLLQDTSQTRSAKRVAVIGAGAAGTSFAYHLRNYTLHENISVAITIYDRNEYIGGRSTTVNVYDEVFEPVELGASIFVSVNHILQHAVSAFDLSTAGRLSSPYTLPEDPDELLGIWDGSSFLLTHRTDTPNNPLELWWRKVRLLWRYGIAPLRTQNLVKDVVGRFLHLYDAPYFPFASLTQAVRMINLTPITSVLGWDYLKQHDLAGDFAWHLVQAATRVNYASDLTDIHGVECMVSMAADGAVSVDGGNWQIFAGMANASYADVRLRTEVGRVRMGEHGRGYVIDAEGEYGGTEDFDAVLLAAPFHQAKLQFEHGILAKTPADDPYRELFVTLFTTPLQLSREFFNLSLLDDVPTTVLTTLPACMKSRDVSCSHEQPSPPFYSISTLRALQNPMNGRHELLYKIFSAEPVSDGFLADLLGLEVQSDGRINKGDVSWRYTKRWLSYPIEYPRETFEPVRLDNGLADGIWYTAGMEGFISTMETNALMGKNVAQLLVDAWTSKCDVGHRAIWQKDEPIALDEL